MSHLLVVLRHPIVLKQPLSTLVSLFCLAATSGTVASMVQREVYQPPPWTHPLTRPPSERLRLANLPTPIHAVSTTNLFPNNNNPLFVKRDDATAGVELGGNKCRKLEFLLADATKTTTNNCYDCVVTIGGAQSNHCRATAAAARLVGLQPHLILRTTANNCDTTGNLLFDRLAGAHVYTVRPGEYGRVGSTALVARLCDYLRKTNGTHPYPIPVGGSNGVGTWGYIEAVEEVMQQGTYDHIVFACGSGGTAAGIALGMHLYCDYHKIPSPTLHAVGVCDSPEYFFQKIAEIGKEMGFQHPDIAQLLKQHLVIHQGKGMGYAVSSEDELAFISKFARETGIALDPVYSGKALYNFVEYAKMTNVKGKILFWHTGGALGLYDKVDSLPLDLECKPLDIYGTGNGIDISADES